ncbi:hypothetical protein [Actinomyces denticolens]|uniref:hypothetical protein n=1 Tax=Actinomyces denticolens TaxID=52767 RepID=UPI001FC95AE1|nr:hypothetical protein [Actinomyces denticolens]
MGPPASLTYAGRAVSATSSTPATLTGAQGSGGGILTVSPSDDGRPAGAAGAAISVADAGTCAGWRSRPARPRAPRLGSSGARPPSAPPPSCA